MNCNCKKPKCDCDSGCDCTPKCSCLKPFLDIESVPGNISMLKYNLNGVSSWYNFRPMIEETETDTSISVDSVKRVLTYMAERHVDTISAKELGSILHLADISDIDIADVENNSLLVFKKENNCAEGCEGPSNKWVGFDSYSNTDSSLQLAMGFDANGAPHTLSAPANANQFYQLGWNAENKLSYSQPRIVASAPVDTDNKKWALYVDPTTREIVIVKEGA